MSDVQKERARSVMLDMSQSNVVLNARLWEDEQSLEARKKNLDLRTTIQGRLSIAMRVQVLDGIVDVNTYKIVDDVRLYIDEIITERYGLAPSKLAPEVKLVFDAKVEQRRKMAKKIVNQQKDVFKKMGLTVQLQREKPYHAIFVGEDLWIAVSTSDSGKVKKTSEIDSLAGLVREFEEGLNDTSRGYGLLIAGAFSPLALQYASKLRFACLTLYDWYRFQHWLLQHEPKEVAPYLNLLLNRYGHVDIEMAFDRIGESISSAKPPRPFS